MNIFKVSTVIIGVAILYGCGGGGGSGTVTISGTAAVGAPIDGGTVDLACKSGSALSATSDSNGNWSLNLSDQTLPCKLRVSGGFVSGTANTSTYHSVATAYGTANISPLTDLVVASLARDDPSSWFAKRTAADFDSIDPQKVSQTIASVVNNLGLNNLLLSDNPLSTPFIADVSAFDPIDRALEALKAAGPHLNLVAAAKSPNFATLAVSMRSQIADAIPNLSASQINFARSARTGYFNFYWNLPTDGPVDASKHYFVASEARTNDSPERGIQVVEGVTINLTESLPKPNPEVVNSFRYAKDGEILIRNGNSRSGEVLFSGENIYFATFATNGKLLYRNEFDVWSRPIPLTGTIDSSAELKIHFGFSRINTPSTLDWSVNWRPGSSYVRRELRLLDEVMVVYDWTGRTYGNEPNVWRSYVESIESAFSEAEAKSGGFGLFGTKYLFSDGSISIREGFRTWVANQPLPTSVSPTTAYACFFEYRSTIYLCRYTPAGVRNRTGNYLDPSSPINESIRLNEAATLSIKDAVLF